MSKSEIKGLFCWKNLNGLSRWTPCGLNLYDKLWWRFMPGVVVNVKWPKGQIKVGPSHRDGYSGYGPEFEYVDSADPNDHYRPWLEEHIGKQGWDWNWGMANMDATENRLTIKICKSKEQYATLIALRWA